MIQLVWQLSHGFVYSSCTEIAGNITWMKTANRVRPEVHCGIQNIYDEISLPIIYKQERWQRTPNPPFLSFFQKIQMKIKRIEMHPLNLKRRNSSPAVPPLSLTSNLKRDWVEFFAAQFVWISRGLVTRFAHTFFEFLRQSKFKVFTCIGYWIANNAPPFFI